jgi:predicted ATPase
MELLTGDVAARWAAGAINREHAQLLWNTLPVTVQALVEVGPDLIDTFVSSNTLVERAAANSSANTNWLARLDGLVQRKTNGAVLKNMPQSDLFEQYTKVLQALARQAPIILVVDDLQWADLGSISLLFHLGRHLPGHRILIVGAYRPEEIALGRDGTRHPLESVINEFQREYGDIAITLGKAENRDFINAILDSESNQLDVSFREMLYRQTHGHPLFTIELLRGMQERGDLVQNPGGQWEEGLTLDWETMPARVEAVIAERIGRLDQPVQEVLRVASVEGQVFTAEVIAQVCATPERDILGLLSQDLDRKHHLIRSHSIQRLGDQLISCYRFRHILFQKYLYNSLDEVERVHLHEQIGTTLEGLYQDDDERAIIAPQLARHFQEARIVQKGVHYLHQAGEKALQLSAYREGIVHLTRGLPLLMTLPESPERDQQELLLQLTLSFAWQGRIGAQAEEVGDALIRARELCQLLGQTSKLCQVMGGLAMHYYVRAEYQKAIDLAEETLRLAHQVDDPLIEALGHWFLGLLLMCIGEFSTALSYLDKVTVFYEPQHHHHTFVYLRGSDAGVGISVSSLLFMVPWLS